MKLLILTQVVDVKHPVLGFFHNWVIELSKRAEHIHVIALQVGEHDLPENVTVHSLGKEDGAGRFEYVRRFYSYIWKYRSEYNNVFVHMNQEYILLAGVFWRFFRKNIYMWRNHHSGNVLTDIAAFFCSKIFCTSKFSYTARYGKTVLMPVGIDTDIFKPMPSIEKKPGSILFLARISSVKKPHILIDALAGLKKRGIEFSASIYGDALPQDEEYYKGLQKKVNDIGLVESITFYGGVPNAQTPSIYNKHKIFVNLSSSGMYDKTIFEAMACKTLVLASNKNLVGEVSDIFIFDEDQVEELSNKLEILLNLPEAEASVRANELRTHVLAKHGLNLLAERLHDEII